jgi:acyl-CoA reductase-like NAD-dependent aldehyde dehydrogenase
VVIFVGKHENALAVHAQCSKDALFIFTGAGVNPVIVGPDADIDLAAAKTAEAKMYNSGQDCAAPDAVLVHHSIADQFQLALIRQLDALAVGGYEDPSTRIGPLIDDESLVSALKFFQTYHDNIVYGGTIDARRRIVYPTIVRGCLPRDRCYVELFAPVIFLSSFCSADHLRTYFEDSRYLEHAMYVTVFGDPRLADPIRNSVVLKNLTVLDVEQGNRPFGGFGRRANFSASRGSVSVRPILISREIWEHKLLTTSSSALEVV